MTQRQKRTYTYDDRVSMTVNVRLRESDSESGCDI